MKFRNQFDNEDLTKYANTTGTEEIDDYDVRLNSNGVKQLVKKKTKRNIYQKIQQYKDECDIYEILRRSDPERRQGLEQQIINANLQDDGQIYDMTQIPTNLIQARQMLIDADKKFNSLPIELRKEFNNNPNEFIAAANNGTLHNKIDRIINKKKEVKLDEPTSGSINNTKSDTSIENSKN